MKRIEVSTPSTIDGLHLTEVAAPKPAPGEILVKIGASTINFHDWVVAAGFWPVTERRVPLSDGAGTVVEIGAGVTEFAVGDVVISTFFADWIDGLPTPANSARMRGDHVEGFASEFVALPAQAFTKAPAGFTEIEAAGLPCAALTAWRALMIEGNIKAGETVLIQGSGGVSVYALQFAKMAGAKVIAVSSSPDKMQRLLELGADHAISYNEFPEWSKQVKLLTGGIGVDHVVEVVGNYTQTLQSLRMGGVMYSIGMLTMQPIAFSPADLMRNNVTIVGLSVGSRQHQQDMVRAIELNGFKPVVNKVFHFSEIAAAFRFQESRAQFGKIGLSW